MEQATEETSLPSVTNDQTETPLHLPNGEEADVNLCNEVKLPA